MTLLLLTLLIAVAVMTWAICSWMSRMTCSFRKNSRGLYDLAEREWEKIDQRQ